MKLSRNIPFIVIAFFAAGVIFTAYLSINTINGTGVGGFVGTIDGTANRPAIYRVLIPKVAQAVAKILPQNFIVALRGLPSNTVWIKAIQNLSGGRYYGEAFSAILIMYFSLAGFILVEKELLLELGYPFIQQYILPLALAALSLPFSVNFAYVYDLPQMFLFATCVLFLYRRNWIAYLVLLAVTSLNKETSFFLIVIFTVYYVRRLPGKVYYLLLTIQPVIFLIIRAVITNTFKNNPGVAMYLSTQEHINQYIAYPPTFIFTILFFGIMTYLILKDWNKKPIFLRYASITYFFVVGLFFIGGMPMEFRIFLDVYPVFGILLFPHRERMPFTG